MYQITDRTFTLDNTPPAKRVKALAKLTYTADLRAIIDMGSKGYKLVVISSVTGHVVYKRRIDNQMGRTLAEANSKFTGDLNKVEDILPTAQIQAWANDAVTLIAQAIQFGFPDRHIQVVATAATRYLKSQFTAKYNTLCHLIHNSEELAMNNIAMHLLSARDECELSRKGFVATYNGEGGALENVLYVDLGGGSTELSVSKPQFHPGLRNPHDRTRSTALVMGSLPYGCVTPLPVACALSPKEFPRSTKAAPVSIMDSDAVFKARLSATGVLRTQLTAVYVAGSAWKEVIKSGRFGIDRYRPNGVPMDGTVYVQDILDLAESVEYTDTDAYQLSGVKKILIPRDESSTFINSLTLVAAILMHCVLHGVLFPHTKVYKCSGKLSVGVWLWKFPTADGANSADNESEDAGTDATAEEEWAAGLTKTILAYRKNNIAGPAQ